MMCCLVFLVGTEVESDAIAEEWLLRETHITHSSLAED